MVYAIHACDDFVHEMKILAVGYHADDQVEMSLMQLGRVTMELGAGCQKDM
jgi:tRNA(Ile)-lysidine synthase TilS/MesJ